MTPRDRPAGPFRRQDASAATVILIICDSIGYLRNAPSCLRPQEGTTDDPLDIDRFRAEK